MLNINKGKIPRPIKTVIYGSEGIGKSTLASQFPDPLFIDTEGGTAQMDVARLDRPKNWDELVSTVNEVAATPDCCKTLVIDTADWAERMCIEHICHKFGQQGLESFGYGKGYTYLAEEWANLMAAVDAVIDSNKNVVIVAHAKQRKQELPDEAGAFDRWEMKLSKQVAPVVKEWADVLLFVNYKSFVIKGKTEMDKNKVHGGKRVIYTTHHPCWDAKNRYGLPDEVDLGFEGIAKIFENAPDANKPISSDTLSKLKARIEQAELKIEEVEQLLIEKGKQPEGTTIDQYTEGFCNGWLRQNWGRVVKAIVNNPERVPF